MNEASIGKMLHRVENQIKRKMDHILSDYGITIVQHIVLEYLAEHEKQGNVFQRDIENAFDVRRSSVSSVLSLLEKKRYIQRRSVTEDARLKKIILTEEGAAVCRVVRQKIKEVERSLESVFRDTQERDLFLDMLQRLSGQVREEQ